jgi:hypothetical protein
LSAQKAAPTQKSVRYNSGMESSAWKYHSDTGLIESPIGFALGEGYSGNGAGLNNPAMESVHNHGPIPRGAWTIGPFHDDPGGKGPVVAHLMPIAITETFGRAGFMVHGDNQALNHSASEGCIVAPRFIRDQIAAGLSVCSVLEVV